MLTINDLLTNISSMIQDDSTALQSKLLIWLNQNIQIVAKMRPWVFLRAGAVITFSAGGVATLPADFNRLIALKTTQVFLPHNLISPSEFTEDVSCGYTLSATEITISPAESGAATLDYIKVVPAYTATDTTVFPEEMRDVLVRMTLTNYYEYDMDERAGASLQLTQLAMKLAKKWDNGLKPLPQRTNTIKWINVA